MGNARIVSQSDQGLKVCAAAARISTTEGGALGLLEGRMGGDRDRMLVKKVLSSGHKSLIEHHALTVAMDSVSVLAEQFLIESRLVAFTVKSRRYVDFGGAGFYVPPSLTGELRARYESAMRDRFSDYAALVKLGVPLEDARFVLPYCFASHFYMTLNARSLLQLIFALRYGRGSAFEELRALGEQLAAQFEALYPGVIEAERAHHPDARPARLVAELHASAPAQPRVTLTAAPADAPAALERALDFTGRYRMDELRALTRDARARELEALCYTFLLEGVSQACVTHFARHRMQSPLFEPALYTLNRGRYVLPETVAAEGGEALERYEAAFRANERTARALGEDGLAPELLSYFALSGHTARLMLTMNARELSHFMRLRTCERAQWEIRAFSQEMLRKLTGSFPELFRWYGPGCAVTGRCPEGRLSCGRPKTL